MRISFIFSIIGVVLMITSFVAPVVGLIQYPGSITWYYAPMTVVKGETVKVSVYTPVFPRRYQLILYKGTYPVGSAVIASVMGSGNSYQLTISITIPKNAPTTSGCSWYFYANDDLTWYIDGTKSGVSIVDPSPPPSSPPSSGGGGSSSPPSTPSYTLKIEIVSGSGTVYVNDSAWLSGQTGTYPSGTSLKIKAEPSSGYKFKKYEAVFSTTTIPFYDSQISVTLNGNVYLKVYFETIPTYTVSAQVVSGLGYVRGTGTYKEGESVTLVAEPAINYEFEKWEDGSTNPNRTIIVTENITVYAYFKRIVYNYTLTVNVNPPEGGQVNVIPQQNSYQEGTTVSLSAQPNQGWKFVNWSGDASGSSKDITITMDSNKTVCANFEKVYVTLKVNVFDNQGNRVENATVSVGEYSIFTNSQGIAVFDSSCKLELNSQVNIIVEKEGFYSKQESVVLDEETKEVSIYLELMEVPLEMNMMLFMPGVGLFAIGFIGMAFERKMDMAVKR